MDRESVGAKIRELRKSRGVTGKDLASRIGLSAAAVSKFESGRLRPTEAFIEAVIQALQMPGRDAFALRELSAFVNSQFARWSLDQKSLASNQISHAMRERNSRSIRSYFNQIVPGLLQSESYMREIFQVLVDPTKADINRLVRERIKRQKILSNNRKQFTFVLAEGALRTCFNSPRILKEQLIHLQYVIRSYPTVEVRVLPWQTVLQRFVLDSFIIFDERTVNIEVSKGELDLWTADDVSYYIDTMNYLSSASFSPIESSSFIEDILQNLEC